MNFENYYMFIFYFLLHVWKVEKLDFQFNMFIMEIIENLSDSKSKASRH